MKLSITDLTNKFFIATKDVKIETYRTYLSFTLSDNKVFEHRYKNIYNRTNAETDLKKVVEYFKIKNLKICQEFLTKCEEYGIYF